MNVTVYEARDETSPGNRFVALIDYDGFKGSSPHLCSSVRCRSLVSLQVPLTTRRRLKVLTCGSTALPLRRRRQACER